MTSTRATTARLSLLVLAVALAAPWSGSTLADEKDKNDKKKIEIANWPKTCGKQDWDLSAVEENYIIKKAKVDEHASVVFLVELKEDAKFLKGFKVEFYDKEGVKLAGMLARATFDIQEGKKGDVARLSLDGWPAGKSASGDALWAKVVKVKIVR